MTGKLRPSLHSKSWQKSESAAKLSKDLGCFSLPTWKRPLLGSRPKQRRMKRSIKQMNGDASTRPHSKRLKKLKKEGSRTG